jgi:uncharacterized protein YndB with AHSA1/START domain
MTAVEELVVPDISVSTYINVPPKKVFEHISTGVGWDAWFTTGTTVDLSPGGQMVLRWRDWGVKHIDYEANCPIIEIDPPNKFVYQWTSGECQTTITLTCAPMGEGTKFSVMETGYMPTEEGLWGFMDCSTGWGEAITLLKFYLEHGVTYGPVPELS